MTDTPEAFKTVPSWIDNKRFHLAMRAILPMIQKHGLPKSYLIDLAQDFSFLSENPIEKFVFCLRDCGTRLFCPMTINGLKTVTSFEAVARSSMPIDPASGSPGTCAMSAKERRTPRRKSANTTITTNRRCVMLRRRKRGNSWDSSIGNTKKGRTRRDWRSRW